MFVSEDLNQPQSLASVVCGGIMVVSSLSQALFWQDKAQARRGWEGGKMWRESDGREGGERGQESGTFLLEGKLPEGRLRQGQPLSVERRDTLLFAYFPALRQRNISSSCTIFLNKKCSQPTPPSLGCLRKRCLWTQFRFWPLSSFLWIYPRVPSMQHANAVFVGWFRNRKRNSFFSLFTKNLVQTDWISVEDTFFVFPFDFSCSS